MVLISIHGFCKQIILTATVDMFHSWGHMIEDEAFKYSFIFLDGGMVHAINKIV